MQPQAFQPSTQGQTYDPLAIYREQDPQAQDPAQNQPQSPATHPGNWFTHLLPTAGGIGGGIGGAALGATIGSAVPILGTGIGGVLGGILGATFGGGAAKAGENLAEEKGIGDGVGTTAIESGLGQAAGGVAGKLLGKGVGFLANRATGIRDAAQVVGDNVGKLDNSKTMNAIYSTSKNDVGHAAGMADQAGLDMAQPAQLQDAGKQLVSNAGDTLSNIVGTTKIPISGAVDEAGAKVAPSIDDLIHSSLTNTNPLTGEKLGASRSLVLGGLGPNQTDEDLLRNGYTRFLSSSAKNGTQTPATGYLQEANQLLSGVNHGSTANANELLDAQRLVGDKAHSINMAAAKPSANEVTQAQADSWNQLNHSLQDMIYSHPDVSQAAKDMVGTHTAADFGGNQQLADMFNSRITAAQSGKDLNSLMHDSYNLRNVGADGVATVSNPASAGTMKLANMANDGATAGETSALDTAHSLSGSGKILPTVLNGLSHLSNNPGLLDTVSRAGALTAKLAPAAGVAAATSNNIIQNDGTVGNTMQPNQQPMPQPMQQPANDPATAKMLFDLGLYSPGALASLAPSQQQIQNVTNANSASTALAGLGNAPTGGIFSALQGQLGIGKTGEYQRQAASVSQQVGSALGVDPHAIEGQLTNYLAGGANIHDAVNQLMERLHGVSSSNQSAGLGGILGVNSAPSSIMGQVPAMQR